MRRKYGGIYAKSRDGLKWSLHGQPQGYSRTVRWDDGTVQTLGNLERPFLLFQNGKPTHLFAAVSDGSDGFKDASDTWNMVIPLKQ